MATTSTAKELEARKRQGQHAPVTMAGSLSAALLAAVERSSRVVFPNERYRLDPVAFAREILGVAPWSRQIDILHAVRDHKRVAVSSGHKVSKSHSCAILALWYYCSWEDARCVMTSTTSRQVDQILWREVRMMRARGGRCVACKKADPSGLKILRPCEHSSLVEGDQGELARTGLKSPDFREIVGFTAREAEGVAGISGKNLLYICDEASGIPEEIFEAMEGNRAGGARAALFSNPTQNSGEFYEAFHGKKAFYFTLRISSEETPNVVEGRDVIPGLANREWIEEKKLEWGEDSALYKVRVKGEHATHEDGKIFSIHAISQAEQRWPVTAEAGRLYVGLDPAGESGSGDETVYAPRRGLKVLELVPHRGLNDEQHLVHLLTLLAKHKLPREVPVVVLDREGSIGSSLAGLLRNFVELNPTAFELVVVRASDRAIRNPVVYDRARDELAANLEGWLRDGGAIPEDVKLSAELHVLEWKQDVRGRLKLTPKDAIRKAIGRSPDRYDAVSLSVWEPLSLKEDLPPSAKGAAGGAAPGADDDDQPGGPMDPYAGSDAWRKR
jgi:hypothetical protein